MEASSCGYGKEQRAGLREGLEVKASCHEEGVFKTPIFGIKNERPRIPPPRKLDPVDADSVADTKPAFLPINKAQAVLQPKVEPSPCLRKSHIPKDIAASMFPLGQADKYSYKHQEEYVSSGMPDRVYSGNPFAAILRSQKHTWVFENKNDLSELEDLLTSMAKKNNDVVKTENYRKELVILMSKEDPTKSLDTPGQPPHIRVPLAKVRKSGCIFAKLLVEKDKKGSIFSDSSIVYSFDSSPKPNLHIHEYAVYVDTLMLCDTAKQAKGYPYVMGLTLKQVWMGLQVWSSWTLSESFSASYTEEEVNNALAVSLFVHDSVYSTALDDMVDRRDYHLVYPSVRAIWSALWDILV